MEGEDLATDCSSGSHGTSVVWLQKGMCSGQLYLYPEWSEVHQFVQADFLCNEPPEDDDDTTDLYDSDDSDDDDESDDSETEDSY